VQSTASAALFALLLGSGCSAAGAAEPPAEGSSADQAEAPSSTVAGEMDPQHETVAEGMLDDVVVQTEAALDSPSEESTPASGSAATTTGASASGAEGAGAESSVAASSEPAVARDTMYTQGRQLLDSCGNPFVTRGVEQVFGEQLPQGNDWAGLLEEIANSGVNAVRILAGTDRLTTLDVDALLGVVKQKGLVAYVTPYGDEATRWLEHQEVRDMLAKHEKYILIDAFGEPTFDDRARFISESTKSIRDVRSWGYRVPLTVTANQYGRDLPSLFELGEQILAEDPLHNVVFGWQAYWGRNGYYQQHYGMDLAEAVEAVAKAPIPIQLGLDHVTDYPSTETADYGTLLTATAKNGIGWLWWDWYNPYGSENNLTENGEATRLTDTGNDVVHGHAASVANTAKLPCIAR
jgi:mannan endo-1,4-beta-mannosidase